MVESGRSRKRTVAFIGGGNMATALVRGLIAERRRPASLVVAEPISARRASLKRRFAVNATASNEEAACKQAMATLAQAIEQTNDLTLFTDGEPRYGHMLFEICQEVIRTGQVGRPKKHLSLA